MNGRSKAIQLPKALGFEAEEVVPAGYWEMVDSLADDLELSVEPINPSFLDLELDSAD